MTLRCVHKVEAVAQGHGTLRLEGPPRHTANRVFFNVPLGALPELREGLAVTPTLLQAEGGTPKEGRQLREVTG